MVTENQNQPESAGDLIEIIKADAIVNMKMSTGFYRRLQELTASLVRGKSGKEVQDAHQQIQDQKIVDEWVGHYETMLILCREFEQLAKDGGYTEKLPLEEVMKLMNQSED